MLLEVHRSQNVLPTQAVYPLWTTRCHCKDLQGRRRP
uniref:Uncharacterized protein n=1 Tax=Arundo donax TaxID=35708 RepID=A0A0A9E286_ARUDO